jgi:hypothetical protein
MNATETNAISTNDRLTNAAPDLLEAVKAAVFAANAVHGLRAMQEILPQLKAALMKAQGSLDITVKID